MKAAHISELLRRPARRLFPKALYTKAASILNLLSCVVKVGFGNTIRLRSAERGIRGTEPIKIKLPQLLHPFYMRPGTTDATSVVQNIVREEWGALLPSEPIRYIIDAGANCGDTTVWYLSKFPHATVFAIEPDPDNFAILSKNCEPYGSRAVLFNAALWSKDATLNLRTAMIAIGTSVEEVEYKSGNACKGISMPHLLRSIDTETIDILKVDIEGAEQQLFSSHPEEWLPGVRYVAVETHGQKEMETVYSAMRELGFENRTFRNVHIFRRPAGPVISDSMSSESTNLAVR